MHKKPRTGLIIAGAVASLIAAGCGSDGDVENANNSSSDPVRCAGINECAGHGECANPGQGNSCEGQNSCAGEGWVTVDTEEACTSEGGTVVTDS